ncbi:MAG: hypothetical protein QW341_01980 [Candidatus Bathyarchaeia archaeon]
MSIFRAASKFLNAVMSLGLSRGEADSLFKMLLKEGKLALDPSGDWRWTDG